MKANVLVLVIGAISLYCWLLPDPAETVPAPLLLVSCAPPAEHRMPALSHTYILYRATLNYFCGNDSVPRDYGIPLTVTQLYDSCRRYALIDGARIIAAWRWNPETCDPAWLDWFMMTNGISLADLGTCRREIYNLAALARV